MGLFVEKASQRMILLGSLTLRVALIEREVNPTCRGVPARADRGRGRLRNAAAVPFSWLLPSQCRQGHPLNDTGLDPANVQFQGAVRSLEEWIGTIRQGDLQVAWALGLVL